MTQPKILIVDDESDIRSLVEGILVDEGYAVEKAGDSTTAWERITSKRPDLVLLDIWLEGSQLDGMEILKKIKRVYPDVSVIMISGHGNIETAIEAIKIGAYDFIEKPFKSDRLIITVKRALETSSLQQENIELKNQVHFDDELSGESDSIVSIRETLGKAAQTNSRVLLTGEHGVGKEVAARYLHKKSDRSGNMFVVVNCATLHSHNYQEELLGVEDHSGVEVKVKPGLLEKADGGTLFFDEVADLPIEVQAKLVNIIQTKEYQRVGGKTTYSVDVRMVASSHRNLEQLIRLERFREDLYYRLNVVPVHIPSLQERTRDIPVLAEEVMNSVADKNSLKPLKFSKDTLIALQQYHWPGNIRQLKNVMEWLLITGSKEEQREYMKGWEGNTIRPEALPPEIIDEAPSILSLEKGDEMMRQPLREAREVFEREYIQAHINRFGGNISKTADFIEMERSALHRKMKSLNIHSNANKKVSET